MMCHYVRDALPLISSICAEFYGIFFSFGEKKKLCLSFFNFRFFSYSPSQLHLIHAHSSIATFEFYSLSKQTHFSAIHREVQPPKLAVVMI